jgi:quinol monooxygenase YgiN
MIIYSYRLTTDDTRRPALVNALATLDHALTGRPGFAGTRLHQVDGTPNQLRFEESWHSAEAHDAAMDDTLKTALKAVLASVSEPARSERFAPLDF